MKTPKIYLYLVLWLFLIHGATAQDLIIKQSDNNQKVTIDKLKSEMKSRGLNVVQHVKHSEAAKKVNLDLSPADVIIFGNPEVGTKLMQADPKVAIELPLKILIWEEKGVTNVAFHDPNRLLQSYQLENQKEILGNMRQMLDAITNEAIR
ncbi:MAG TPA: DUF302 domain-containing protein [Anditalea sp.]|nr:DUF302 domain-containing protein [Anditalea sp.]